MVSAGGKEKKKEKKEGGGGGDGGGGGGVNWATSDLNVTSRRSDTLKTWM